MSTTGNNLDGETVLDTTPALQAKAVNLFDTFCVQNQCVYLLEAGQCCCHYGHKKLMAAIFCLHVNPISWNICYVDISCVTLHSLHCHCHDYKLTAASVSLSVTPVTLVSSYVYMLPLYNIFIFLPKFSLTLNNLFNFVAQIPTYNKLYSLGEANIINS